jgi:hypothetical protein
MSGMSILCDLFVADPSDAQHDEERFDDEEWVGRFDRRQFGGITQLEFETLASKRGLFLWGSL